MLTLPSPPVTEKLALPPERVQRPPTSAVDQPVATVRAKASSAYGATPCTVTVFVTTLEARPWLSLTVSFTEYVFADAYV